MPETSTSTCISMVVYFEATRFFDQIQSEIRIKKPDTFHCTGLLIKRLSLYPFDLRYPRSLAYPSFG